MLDLHEDHVDHAEQLRDGADSQEDQGGQVVVAADLGAQGIALVVDGADDEKDVGKDQKQF